MVAQGTQRFLETLHNPTIRTHVFLGCLLGLVSFWNGTVTISGILIVSFLAICWKNYQLLIIPFLALSLTQILTWWFVGNQSPISPQIAIGFLAENSSITAIAHYYLLLFGILPVILLIAFLKMTPRHRWWVLAFLAPFVLANSIQIGESLVINHKFINISVLLINIFAAYLVVEWFSSGRKYYFLATCCLIALTASGAVDLLAVWNSNKRIIMHSLSHPLTVWAANNTRPHDIFLTNQDLYNPILWAGRRVFLGVTQFNHSAGYDVQQRTNTIRRIQTSKSIQDVQQQLAGNHVNYIVVKENKDANPLWKQHYSQVFFDELNRIPVYQVP